MGKQEPANDRSFVTIEEPYEKVNEPGAFYMVVRIDTFSDLMRQHEPVICGIADAVSKYVEKEKAAEIFAGIQNAVKEQVEIQVKQYVEKQCYAILSKLDIETMAKLATIGAAKEIGNRVGA